MTRATARIKHDEVVRLVKAVRACGLGVARVSFDGAKVDVIIGDIVDAGQHQVDASPPVDGPIREPHL